MPENLKPSDAGGCVAWTQHRGQVIEFQNRHSCKRNTQTTNNKLQFSALMQTSYLKKMRRHLHHHFFFSHLQQHLTACHHPSHKLHTYSDTTIYEKDLCWQHLHPPSLLLYNSFIYFFMFFVVYLAILILFIILFVVVVVWTSYYYT